MLQQQQRIQLKEILKQNPYKPISKVSYGAYGQIFKIVCINDQKDYILKIVSKQKMNKQKKLHQAFIQGYLLNNFNHPNIVKYINTIQTKQYICQVLQFCPFGDLFNLMKKINKNFQLIKRKKQIILFYLAQIVNVICYLHQKQIIHRDLKPQNIIIGSDFHIRLIDFGTAKTLDLLNIYNQKQIQQLQKLRLINQKQNQQLARRQSFVGSANYISPQSINMNHTLSSDIWSFGVIVYKIFHNKLPFEGQNNYIIFKNIKSTQYKIDQNLSQQVKDLIKVCLVNNPQQRPSAQQLKKHKYFTNINFKTLTKQKPPINQKALRLTQIQLKPIKDYKMQILLQKKMFFGNYKPRILKMYDRQKKLYMSYWYLDKDIPKNQFQIKIDDYAQIISQNQFQVKNDDVRYTFRVQSKHTPSDVVHQINLIIRKFYNLQ